MTLILHDKSVRIEVMITELAVVKTCARCKAEKALSEFTRSKTNTTGRHSYCKPCMTAYYHAKGGYAHTKERFRGYRVARCEYVRARKVALGCADCGDKREPVLEFHHADPATKTATLNQLMTRSASRALLDAEMDKCIVLCSNCHRVRHHHERQAKREQFA